MPKKAFIDRKATKEFGRFIRKARDKRNLSLAGVARQVGVSPAYLSRVEKGERSMFSRPDYLDRLAAALDIDPNILRTKAQPKEFTIADALKSLGDTAAGLRQVRLSDERLQTFYRGLGKTVEEFTNMARLTEDALGGPKLEKKKGEG